MSKEMISPEFRVYKLTQQGIDRLEYITSIFDCLLSSLGSLCPTGREFSIVKTKLEEACFFAKKSASTSPEFHVKNND